MTPEGRLVGREATSEDCLAAAGRLPLARARITDFSKDRLSIVAPPYDMRCKLRVFQTTSAKGVIPTIRLNRAAFAVHVSGPRPVTQPVGRAILISALRHDIENAVNSEELL